jgi:hypothetical protein
MVAELKLSGKIMRVHVALAVLTALFSVTTPVSAAKVYVTYTGQVTSSLNRHGNAFGDVSASGLTGMDFRAVFNSGRRDHRLR